MPKIKVNDIDIYYEIYGEGKPLIFIMGQGGTVKHFKSSITFKKFEEFIFNEHKTLIFDNRGIGQTDDLIKKYTINSLADDVAGLIDALNLGKVNLLGFSMGSMIIQELIINYPEKIKKSIIGSTHCGRPKYIMPSTDIFTGPPPFQEGINPEELIKYEIPLVYTKNFIDNNPEIIESIIQNYIAHPVPPEITRKQINAVFKFKSCKRLPTVQIPTLILHGKDDLLVPYQNAQILAELIPKSELKIFENCGHSLFTEQTEAVMDAIHKFLK
ncbi:MAG: alpha/beta hydrolase [Promethearchaeota archaeon]|nr:MAG: alpha/beta hydrolase [Candidatus Lokiarchaeota archaeon]